MKEKNPPNSQQNTTVNLEPQQHPSRDSKLDDTKVIFTLLKSAFNVDFTHYKESTVRRRITRRMLINQIDSLECYADYLRAHPEELQTLFDNMLIGVTYFFREPNVFNSIKEKVYPTIIRNRAPDDSIRIWIPGCSTGEEAYSIAITLQDFLEDSNLTQPPIQIVGTDINAKNIQKARLAIYPKKIEEYVSERRLQKFFTQTEGNYQIIKPIRDMCIFEKQDLTQEPLFSNFDIVCCRNVLIYFDSYLQERVIPILHHALKPNGFLVLGESETVGKYTDLFCAMEKNSAIFIKKIVQR